MKVQIFEHKLKIKYADDLPKVVSYFAKHNIPVEFSKPEKTKVLLRETPWKLYLPNDPGDILMYIFDRKQRSHSFAMNFSKTLQCIEVSTSVVDDKIDYTWKLIAHELIHCLFHKLHNLNINVQDPMDSMLVNGVWTPYYKNDEPDAPNGNFAEAWKRLAPYMHLLGATTPTLPSLPYVELTRTLSDTNQTTGILEAYNNGAKFTCKTLELAWKDNKPNISCIPKGTYKCTYTFSPRFLKYTYEVQAVPNRSGIRIHSANYVSQLNGCVALGSNLVDTNGDGKLDTINSRITIDAFEKFMGKKPFTLKIL